MTGAPLLELTGISKRFGGVVALSGASLVVRSSTVHAVLGENGAGKTTLMRIAYGMMQPDAGELRINGRSLALASPASAIDAGVGMVHQHFTLVPSMTVEENLALGGRGRLRAVTMTMRVADIANRTGFHFDAKARVDSLSVGAQQRVEIAKAIARNPSLLILDEPTAVLTPLEVDDLLRWLRGFVAEGHAVVLITHKLHEALAVSDDVTVMRAGQVTLSARASEVTLSGLTTAMLGEHLDSVAPVHAVSFSGGAKIIDAQGVTFLDAKARQVLDNVSLTVYGGEIVGIAAIEGSGQHELLRALAGRLAITSGRITTPPIVGFVPEDRHRDAVLLDRSLTENVALRGAGRRNGRIDWRTMRQRTESLLQAFDVRAPNAETRMRALSGGNQQKLVLARELEHEASGSSYAVIADNATRGLDVRAAASVHLRLREAARGGAAVVIYSSDLDELLALADRIVVLRNGQLHGVPFDRAIVGRAMLGVDP